MCDTCKDAHNDILKREISRVNNQIKRGMNRIDDALSQVERNQQQLKTNADTVRDGVSAEFPHTSSSPFP